MGLIPDDNSSGNMYIEDEINRDVFNMHDHSNLIDINTLPQIVLEK